jgi:CxxC-x17-CxxC domain-containing protein
MQRNNNRRDRGHNESRSYGGGFNNNNFNRGEREMHKTKCAECGNECEVPFKPTEGRPVYCRDCYSKHKR